MTSLPCLVAFLGEGDDAWYLGCKSNGSLSYSFPVLDKAAKFAVQGASIGNGFVHIRSCSNNKYWVRSSASGYSIVAGATDPNEDTKSWNCTLFKPTFEGSKNVIFRHVQAGQNVGRSPNLEFLLMPHASAVARSRFFDYNIYVILPKYVSFKDDRGKFYQLHWQENHPYLQASGSDSGSTRVMHETSYNRHGNYLFKNRDTGKFWRRNHNWIWADHDKCEEWNLDILFWPVTVDYNVVAFRNLGINNFVRRLSKEYKGDCLNADADSIITEARFTVVEPVLTRVVEVTEFRLKDARIYDHQPVVMAKNSATNRTNSTETTTLGFSYTDSRSSTWSNTIGVSLGVKVKFSAGVPLIGQGEVEVSTKISETYQWGEQKQWSQLITGSETATVPPHTQVIVKMVATKGKCDVPFSYRQSDTLIDGRVVTNTYHDGVFTGVNAFDVRFDNTEVALK